MQNVQNEVKEEIMKILRDKVNDTTTNPDNFPYVDFNFVSGSLARLNAIKFIQDLVMGMQYYFKIQNFKEYEDTLILFIKCVTYERDHGMSPETYDTYKIIIGALIYISKLIPQTN